MGKIRDLLKGNKTNIQAIAAGIVVALFAAGVIDGTMAAAALGFLGAGSVASIGAKIDRAVTASEPPTP